MVNVSFCIRLLFRRGFIVFSEMRAIQFWAIGRPNCDVVYHRNILLHMKKKRMDWKKYINLTRWVYFHPRKCIEYEVKFNREKSKDESSTESVVKIHNTFTYMIECQCRRSFSQNPDENSLCEIGVDKWEWWEFFIGKFKFFHGKFKF